MAKAKKQIILDEPKKRSLYTKTLTDTQIEKLDKWLDKNLFAPFSVEHSLYAYRGQDVVITVYKSRKMVISGKGTEDFVAYVLEPKITEQIEMGYEEVNNPEWFQAHAGVDESGKGDLFGPLVSSCVIADAKAVRYWIDEGLKESKRVSSDFAILSMAKKIKATEGVVVKVSYANMEKYNALYIKFGRNLNKLLAWMHATAVKSALEQRHVPWGMLDQFTKQPLVQNQLNIEGFELKMQTKAESDPVVAAASIMARATYVLAMQKLSKEAGITLKKGASAQVKEQAKQIIAKFGAQELKKYAKMHFKTATEAINE